MSVLGLVPVFYQVQDGAEKVISYASQSLTKSKTKYLVLKLEFLCLKWAVTDQFHKYLYGNMFDVYTENNPLTYMLTTAKLDAMGHRWIAGLANYNFNIHYRSGESNVEADVLSRIDWEKCDETIQADSIQAIVAAAITVHGTNHIEPISCSPQTIDSILPSILHDTLIVSNAIMWSSGQNHLTQLETESSKLDTLSHLGVDNDSPLKPKCITPSDWVEAQSRDKMSKRLFTYLKQKNYRIKKIRRLIVRR